MRRLIAWSLSLLFVAAGLLWPLLFDGASSGSPVEDPVVITDYRAEYVVGDDGELEAKETITGMFPSGRHGIFRYWDVANPNNSRIRQLPQVDSVQLDGGPVPYQMLWEDGDRFRVARIGDPDSTLDYGEHVYEIRYTIPGVLDPGDTGADRRFAASTGDLDARRRSSGTSSHRRGTTASNAPRSPSACPAR